MGDELVTISTFFDYTQAEMFCNYLQSEGFNAFVIDNNMTASNPLLVGAIGGVRVQVPQGEAEEAKQFIENWNNAEIDWDEFERKAENIPPSPPKLK